jgi:hypothetical protein
MNPENLPPTRSECKCLSQIGPPPSTEILPLAKEIRINPDFKKYFDLTPENINEKQQKILKQFGHCEIIFIVDDNYSDLIRLISIFKASIQTNAPNLNETSIISGFQTGESLLETYQKFNEISQNSKNTTQYFLLDGDLGENAKYNYGSQVLSEIIKLRENDLDNLYIGGVSNSSGYNNELKDFLESRPNMYIGYVNNKNSSYFVPILLQHTQQFQKNRSK